MNILWIIVGLMVVSILIRLFSSHSRRQAWMQARQATMTGKPQANSAMDMLGQRYAKGEISKEEYEQKKKDLMS